MSYFMTTSGRAVQFTGVEPVELIRAGEAQHYLQKLEQELSARDGSPVFLVHDGTTGTSHDLVVEAEQRYHVHGSIQGTRLLKVISALAENGNTLRIWWAGGGGLPKSESYPSLARLVTGIEERLQQGRDVIVRFEPPAT